MDVNNVMEHHSPEQQTLAAESQEPPSSHRDLMDDSPARFKRPRLDSGTRETRRLTPDEDYTPAETMDVDDVAPAQDDGQEQSDAHSEQPPTTPSRVTINVRAPQPSTTAASSDARCSDSPAASVSEAGNDTGEDQASSMTAAKPAPSSPQVAVSKPDNSAAEGSRTDSPLSAACSSPINIEADEPEDMNDIGNEVIEIDDDDDASEPSIPFNILQDFPGARRHGWQNALGMFVTIVTKPNATKNAGALTELHIWLSQVLQALNTGAITLETVFTYHDVFWQELATVFTKLIARHTPLEDPFDLDPEQSEEEALADFLSTYTGVVTQMMKTDLQTLEAAARSSAKPSVVMSMAHMAVLADFWRFTLDIPFWNMLKNTFGAPRLVPIGARIARRFLDDLDDRSEGLDTILGMLRIGTAKPEFRQVADASLELASCLMSFIKNWIPRMSPADSRWLAPKLLRFFSKLDKEVSDSLKAPVDICRDLTMQLVPTLLGILAELDRDISLDLVNRFVGDLKEANMPEYYPFFLSYSWQLKTLKQYICKGHMQHRIFGIEAMNQQLVAIWTKWNKHGQYGQAVLQFFAQFLLDEAVVDYIIGVDSHPQLVSRSGNIIGFLAVTHQYSPTQSDAVWNAIRTGQDPRMVEALLVMLNHTIELMEMADLLYLCTKLSDLPPAEFTNQTLDTFSRVCSRIDSVAKARPSEWNDNDGKMNAFDLCLRLLQASFPSEGSTTITDAVHNSAYTQLGRLAGPDIAAMDDRYKMYEHCARDIKSMTKDAAASAEIIRVIVGTTQGQDVSFLTEQLDLTHFVADELCSFVEKERSVGSRTSQDNGLSCRLRLLVYLISHRPTSIPPDLQERVWDHLVGQRALSDSARDIAWHTLSEMVKAQTTGNAFLDRCASDLLPKVDPVFFTPGLFDFLCQLTEYQKQIACPSSPTSGQVLDPSSAELLWRIILTAPERSIEITTASYLASQYLDVEQFRRFSDPDKVVRDTHTALVNRCTEQLVSSHAALSDSKNDSLHADSTKDRASAPQLEFKRSLLFLNVLLNSVRAKKEFRSSPPRTTKPVPISIDDDTRGDPVIVRFQSFDGSSSEIKPAVVSDLESLAWLRTQLGDWTGFSEFQVISGGAILDFAKDGHLTIRDSGIANKGQLLIRKKPDSDPTSHDGPSSVIEATILEHFDTLYDFMLSEDESSEATFEFLRLLPPCGEALAITSTEHAVPASDVALVAFPPGNPYKARYSILTLDAQFKNYMRSGPVNEQYIRHGVQMLDTAILNEKLVSASFSGKLDAVLLADMLQCFLSFLKEQVSLEVSQTYFSDGALLVKRLVSFLDSALEKLGDERLIHTCYAAILEGCVHSRAIWEAFSTRDDVDDIHLELLLMRQNEDSRVGISQIIEANCGKLPDISRVDTEEIVPFYWSTLSKIIPFSTRYPHSCGQLLRISAIVFRKYDELHRDEKTLRGYISTWSELLLKHRHEEFVGRGDVDNVVLGLALLLRIAIQSLKSFKRPLNIENLADRLFTTFLFKPTASHGLKDKFRDAATLPVLDSRTRQELYDLIITLCEDTVAFKKIMDLTQGLFDASGYENESYITDRSRDLRSSTGYVGLENPQFLCYMNSLMTQLFMDLEFRKFILGVKTADVDSSFNLLTAMQKLFADMQSSYSKSVDIRPFAKCVRGLDKRSINISIQMDTEEFFRLLMDQLESQMLSAEDKNRLRSFYGGQSVNQIKSKDCKHVSETMETLFNIPLEVKGKESLEESLKSYVQGESLEGENKYKCEPCGGRLVNAVKRTCLKVVPDNLIMHLKRFDFDPYTMSRSKINDHFHFPRRINMSPYKVEYLSDPDKPIDDDYFELVGILVHAGGVESGHYWSIIRVRPDSDKEERWIKFNDETVTEQDMRNVGSEVYGGNSHTSAYMLLYQRASRLENARTGYLRAAQSLNAIAPLPSELEKSINEENERRIREYCMFDVTFSTFVRSLVAQMRTRNNGDCSEDHILEDYAIITALEHLYHITGRVQDLHELDQTLQLVKRMGVKCTKCLKVGLVWMTGHTNALQNWFIYSHPIDQYNHFAHQVGMFFLEGMRHLRLHDPVAYGIDTAEADIESVQSIDKEGVLFRILYKLRSMVGDLAYCPRGHEPLQYVWDVYFKMLQAIWDLGVHEQVAMLDHGILGQCLEVLSVEYNEDVSRRHPHLKAVVSDRKKGSRPSHNHLISFFTHMMMKMDLADEPCATNKERLEAIAHYPDRRFPTLVEERELFCAFNPKDEGLTVLTRCLEIFTPGRGDNIQVGELINVYILVEPKIANSVCIAHTICTGLDVYHSSILNNFVNAALWFCFGCPRADEARQVIRQVVRAIRPEAQPGETFVQFISQVHSLPTEERWPPEDRAALWETVIEEARSWAIQFTLYDESEVRVQGLRVVRDLITSYKPDTRPGAELRLQAVRQILPLAMKRFRRLHVKGDLSKGFVETLYFLIADCKNYLIALHRHFGGTEGEEDEILIANAEALDELFRSWPETDEFESGFASEDDGEFEDGSGGGVDFM
ncbi:hypothetical protein K490DRAFT_66709 [Saccharata proteae CBS 121410]|uniref:USP domain-containing protein n=1 Tax=Saccharata proteae CBS 121410 TaxID=1314787 RepID=A0A9P4HU55_9PEZI|nr:hypothetical protein K490DRAFT_66709 [Saccharata proteae CBS 121410]